MEPTNDVAPQEMHVWRVMGLILSRRFPKKVLALRLTLGRHRSIATPPGGVSLSVEDGKFEEPTTCSLMGAEWTESFSKSISFDQERTYELFSGPELLLSTDAVLATVALPSTSFLCSESSQASELADFTIPMCISPERSLPA